MSIKDEVLKRLALPPDQEKLLVEYVETVAGMLEQGMTPKEIDELCPLPSDWVVPRNQ